MNCRKQLIWESFNFISDRVKRWHIELLYINILINILTSDYSGKRTEDKDFSSISKRFSATICIKQCLEAIVQCLADYSHEKVKVKIDLGGPFRKGYVKQ